MLTITQGWITAILEHATIIFEDVGPLIILAIGVPIGFWLARKVIGLVRAR